MDISHPASALAALALLCGLAASAQAAPLQRPHVRPQPPAAAGNYVDATLYLNTEAGFEAWDELGLKLKHGFDEVCGDTFCEGDYSNIQSLDYRCSVEAASGTVGQCAWIFAASNEDVDPASGRIVVDARHWSCPSPVAPGTRFYDLLAALGNDDPLDTPLPGSGRSLYDGLVDCL
jgi:hypothetical protein